MSSTGPAGGAEEATRPVLGLLGTAARAIVRLWLAVTGAWQRSIQLRVISATLALSLVVVTLLGATLIRQITDGLLAAQRDAAVADASSGIDTAQRQLDAAEESEPGALTQLLRQIVEDLAARGSGTGSDTLYEVVLLGTDDASVQVVPSQVDPASVPDALREQASDEALVFHTYTTLRFTDDSTPDVAALAVGGQVTAASGGEYELYYLFPLTEQQDTADLVQRALATAGVLLVLLLGALAWLVTRQVVTPVRMAARIAERLSAGKLSERMVVRGRDDLARLATSFNQMAANLQHQIGQLEELSRVQQQFVSDVSHELRTPLTTVRMAADVLHESRDEFDPVVRRSAELLQAQLDRFEGLLTDLLEISRFDAGAAILNAESHDVRELVHKVVDGAAPLAERKGSRILLDLPDVACLAEIDARRIERVLRNLVVNAIEHGEGRDVRVRIVGDEDAVAVAVRDYGVGLKPGEASLVFHRFWRADPARARTTGGSGLGLSISLEDARLNGGWLQAWGEPGEGSQFRLTLPRRIVHDLTSSPLALIPEDAGHQPTTVGVPYRRIGSSAPGGSAAAVRAAPEAGTMPPEPPRSDSTGDGSPTATDPAATDPAPTHPAPTHPAPADPGSEVSRRG